MDEAIFKSSGYTFKKVTRKLCGRTFSISTTCYCWRVNYWLNGQRFRMQCADDGVMFWLMSFRPRPRCSSIWSGCFPPKVSCLWETAIGAFIPGGNAAQKVTLNPRLTTAAAQDAILKDVTPIRGRACLHGWLCVMPNLISSWRRKREVYWCHLDGR